MTVNSTDFLCEFGEPAVPPGLATPPAPGFSMLLVILLSREKTGRDWLDVNALLSSKSEGAIRGTLLVLGLVGSSCSLAFSSSPHKPPAAADYST